MESPWNEYCSDESDSRDKIINILWIWLILVRKTFRTKYDCLFTQSMHVTAFQLKNIVKMCPIFFQCAVRTKDSTNRQAAFNMIFVNKQMDDCYPSCPTLIYEKQLKLNIVHNRIFITKSRRTQKFNNAYMVNRMLLNMSALIIGNLTKVNEHRILFALPAFFVTERTITWHLIFLFQKRLTLSHEKDLTFSKGTIDVIIWEKNYKTYCKTKNCMV